MSATLAAGAVIVVVPQALAVAVEAPRIEKAEAGTAHTDDVPRELVDIRRETCSVIAPRRMRDEVIDVPSMRAVN